MKDSNMSFASGGRYLACNNRKKRDIREVKEVRFCYLSAANYTTVDQKLSFE